MTNQVSISADLLQSELIGKLGDLILQDATFFAIIIGMLAAFLYSFFADPDLPSRKRRGIKFLCSLLVSMVMFLLWQSGLEEIHRDTIIVSIAVGAICVFLQFIGFILIKAFLPKLAAVLEPDQAKHEEQKEIKK